MKTNILPSFDFLRYAENSVKSFNENLNELENHSLAKEMAFLYSLQTLSRYMRTREHYFKEPHFDTEKLVNFAHEILGNKVQTYIKRQRTVYTFSHRAGSFMFRVFVFACLASLAVLLAGCEQEDSCLKYSDFTCDQIDKADYNVYFYWPDQREQYLGETNGLSSCGSMAHSYAYQHKAENSNWGYICCMIANDSSCYEKHR